MAGKTDRAAVVERITLDRRQLYMLPTRYGLYFCMALVAMLLMALNYHNGLAYLFTFLLAAMAVTSMLYTHRNVAGIQITAHAQAPVFAGESAKFNLHAANETPQPRTGVWIHCGERAERLEFGAMENTSVELQQRTTHRGYVDLDPIAVSSAFPVGLLYTWSKSLRVNARCLVYPRPHGSRTLMSATTGGTTQSDGAHAEGDDFIGLRAYHPSDPPRHVHWKASARSQELLTKRFGGGGGTVWLDWDRLAELEPESRLSQLARWVVDAESNGLNYGLRLPGSVIGTDHGKHHRHRCLKALALWSER